MAGWSEELARDLDEWPAWLVLADRLIEEGDERGAYIMDAHQIGFLPPPRRLTAPDDAGPTELQRWRDFVRSRLPEWTRGLPERHLVNLRWRFGFVADVGLPGRNPAWWAALDAALDHPNLRFLSTVSLRVGEHPVEQGSFVGLERFPALLSRVRDLPHPADLDLEALEIDAFWQVRSVHLTDRHLSDAAIGALSRIAWPKLESCRLRASGVTSAGAASLAGARMPRLRHLDLAFDDVGDAGAEALADSWSLPSLDHLDLSCNAIGDAGAAALADAAGLPALVHLDLRDNPLSDAGRQLVAESDRLAWATVHL